jgi:hypothetical protein
MVRRNTERSLRRGDSLERRLLANVAAISERRSSVEAATADGADSDAHGFPVRLGCLSVVLSSAPLTRSTEQDRATGRGECPDN